ncbi:GAP family protein [Pseudonocardia acidicola]|uniref:Sap-like sulfolipid-1-addressing protein n=1 Tax=Pseudonocardia acidicola TaxID=2724939 RepID=A0ABX1SB71_9PSEU|nr:hypothetical protein [Pseudonocardia acidicola]
MLAQAVPPALAAAFWPPALLLVAYLLAGPEPRKHALMLLAGGAVATLGVGFAFVLLLQGTGVESSTHHTVSPWIDVGLGVLLLVFALVVARRPPRGPGAGSEDRREVGLLGLLVAGMVMYSPSPFYLASLHAITKAHVSALAAALSVVLMAGIYMAFVEVPIVLHLVWPQTTVQRLRSVNEWLHRHGRAVILVAAVGFGVYLLFSGIGRLTG